MPFDPMQVLAGIGVVSCGYFLFRAGADVRAVLKDRKNEKEAEQATLYALIADLQTKLEGKTSED